ncbi:MAG: alkaline shock response membrane anchor protein AmaP [Desulfitobacteriaceae bacterium]
MLVYGLGSFFCIVAIWILAIATGWSLPADSLYQGLDWLRLNSWESTAFAALLLLLGLLILFRPRKRIALSFRTYSKLGEVCIAQDALQEIIRRSAMDAAGVRQVQVLLREREAGLEIIVETQVDQEEVITEVSEELQLRVQRDVEHYTGIHVAEVKVLVRSFENTSHQARVR